MRCLEYLLKGKDIVAVLPTAFSKSLLSRRTMILCKMGLTSLHDFYGQPRSQGSLLLGPRGHEGRVGEDPVYLVVLWFVTFIHLSVFVRSLDLFVALLVFMKGTSCFVLRRNFK